MNSHKAKPDTDERPRRLTPEELDDLKKDMWESHIWAQDELKRLAKLDKDDRASAGNRSDDRDLES